MPDEVSAFEQLTGTPAPAYTPPIDIPRWAGEKLHSAVNSPVGKPLEWGLNAMSHSPAASGAYGAAMLGLGGYAGSKLFNYLNKKITGRKEDKVDAKRVALVGSLLGGTAGLGLGMHHKNVNNPDMWPNALDQSTDLLGRTGMDRNTLDQARARLPQKTAMFLLAPSAEIQNEIARDYTLNLTEKDHLMQMVNELPEMHKIQLKSMLASVGGSAIGMIVARYLLKLGFTGQVIASLVGGLVGGSIGNNALDLNRNNLYTDTLDYS